MSLEGKTAIITGAGQGIGLRIAEKLLEHEAHVVLNDLDGDLLSRVEQNLSNHKNKLSLIQGDCSQQHIINKLVDTAVNQHGNLHITIANAGITQFGEFFSFQREAFDKVMNVNLAGTFFLAQAAAKQMIKQGTGGSLLFMSSVTGHQAHKNLSAYGMSKAAIEMLAKNLVVELSPYNINVNTVAPGATMTERTAEDPQYKNTWEKITPLGRPANVNDIAEAVLFLVSGKATHITGQTLVIDGGWTSVSPSPY